MFTLILISALLALVLTRPIRNWLSRRLNRRQDLLLASRESMRMTEQMERYIERNRTRNWVERDDFLAAALVAE